MPCQVELATTTDLILSSVLKAEGILISYTYILIFIYLNKGGIGPFVCFQHGAKPGAASKLWQIKMIVFMQPAVSLCGQDWVKPGWGRRTWFSTGIPAICYQMQKEIRSQASTPEPPVCLLEIFCPSH